MNGNTLNKAFYSRFAQHRGYIKLFALCFAMLIVSCKAKKLLVAKRAVADTTTAVKAVDPRIVKLNAIKSTQTAFNSFSGKAHAKLDINGSGNDVTLNIRIKRDQKIWVSITAIAGIEVARALITPDSILLINRLQSLYVKQPFSYVNKFAGNQVNYKTIETILIGNAMPELLNENATMQITTANTTLSGSLQDLVYKLVVGPDLKVEQTNLINDAAGQSLQVVNGVFIQSGVKVVPSKIDISSTTKDKKILVNLQYVKVDFDQALEYPFSIPSRYTETQ